MVSCKGDRGTSYKVDPWAHMTPYRIQALFSWRTAHPHLPHQPTDSHIPVIIGITDNWVQGEKVSTSGAKVYVQVTNVHQICGDAVLARVAGLLAEEDMDRCPWLHVNLGQAQGAGIDAAPLKKQPWGMAETPATMIGQKEQGYTRMGLVSGWDKKSHVGAGQDVAGRIFSA